jgi:hypothetical protein
MRVVAWTEDIVPLIQQIPASVGQHETTCDLNYRKGNSEEGQDFAAQYQGRRKQGEAVNRDFTSQDFLGRT